MIFVGKKMMDENKKVMHVVVVFTCKTWKYAGCS